MEDWCEAVQGKCAGSYGRLNGRQRGRAGWILLVFFPALLNERFTTYPVRTAGCLKSGS